LKLLGVDVENSYYYSCLSVWYDIFT